MPCESDAHYGSQRQSCFEFEMKLLLVQIKG